MRAAEKSDKKKLNFGDYDTVDRMQVVVQLDSRDSYCSW